MDHACQVDFYVLARPTQSAGELACRLAMRAWEQGHRVLVRVANDEDARRLDEQMWDCPAGRFVPHGRGGAAADAPVGIETAGNRVPGERDLLINLCVEPVADVNRFRRLLEIVPAEPAQRDASREKFRNYRALGLSPETHPMG